MMTCSECEMNLDAVPVGTPCPTCGSLRRDATVSPETVAATAHVFPMQVEPGMVKLEGSAVELSISHAVDALIAQPQVREVAETGELLLRYNPPSADSPGWVVQAWRGDELISMAPASSFRRAYIAMRNEVEDAVSGGGEG